MTWQHVFMYVVASGWSALCAAFLIVTYKGPNK